MVHSHLEFMDVCSMAEDSRMFKLFEKDTDKVKFLLEYLSIFLPNDGTLNNVKQCVPMKDVVSLVTDQDVSFEDVL